MAWFKRIFLFLAVNALVVFTISIVLNVLGIKPYLNANGIDYGSLIVFCLIWGMGGAFISLLLSRVMAKWMMGVQIVPENTTNPQLRAYVQMVQDLSFAAKLPKTPEIGIYESPDINAFATGPSKSRSLVAVSTGLLQKMNKEEMRGVIGHEVAHIANGDMVTMTLIQGVVNAFVMFLSRVIAYALTMAQNNNEERKEPGALFFITQFVLEIVFMILGSIVVAWFSRQREYRADAGGAKLAGKNAMISALESLKVNYERASPAENLQPAVQSLKISGNTNAFLKLFSTHPPLDERIAYLKQNYKGV